ncbi:response regulator [Tropicibacter oceani]|uniref:Response regulator n=1 Tax=Tropicibacter oceani TaxID=3058420 RepID=A0ABY8QP20_9RHOB|nr:response regulator [Tropicibacter oceani]WGW05577.1 response regulator [Tropicibacter oceani]
MTEGIRGDLASRVGNNLPYLRRYARALTGSQDRGDQYAMATLEAILSDPSSYDSALSSKCALFRVFHSIWITTGAPLGDDETGLAGKAQAHLARLTSGTREALLLHTIEELTFDEVAAVMDTTAADAQELVNIAYSEMAQSLSGRVMIIEDEAIIAVDLEAITAEMGHKVTGVARTESAALDLAQRETPDLILSDIQLADNSSGIDAVNKILAAHPDIPVIFITAFPERLLTGEGPEPAFLISKPYTEDQVRSAISQAMFFSSTETLKA